MPDSVYYVEVSAQRATVTVALGGVGLRTVGGAADRLARSARPGSAPVRNRSGAR